MGQGWDLYMSRQWLVTALAAVVESVVGVAVVDGLVKAKASPT